MRSTMAEHYRCPYTHAPLTLKADVWAGDDVTTGALVSPSGNVYPITNGMPMLMRNDDALIGDIEQQGLDFYQRAAADYDRGMDWLFASFLEDEADVRRLIIDQLRLAPTARVLEVGCGSGRDSVWIARALGKGGLLVLQDLSPAMLEIARSKFDALNGEGDASLCDIEWFRGNAAALPFSDGELDAVFHFGAVNTFTDRRRALAEMTRVVREGGRVVVGDEGVAPWLQDTLYGQILKNSNPLYRHVPPLELLPEQARDVCLRWVLGGSFYVIDYTVGVGAPPLDLDLPIPGRRGGTHRTRFYGRLEGVTPEVVGRVERAAQEAQLSTHAWLERTLRAATAAQPPSVPLPEDKPISDKA